MSKNTENLFTEIELNHLIISSQRLPLGSNIQLSNEYWQNWMEENKEFRTKLNSMNEIDFKTFRLYLESKEVNILDIFNNPGKTFFPIDRLKHHLNVYLHKLDKKNNKTKGILDQINGNFEETKLKLEPYSFFDFMNKDDKKEYYIKNLFAKGTVNMIYSPPASMKSFISYYLALCLCTGNDFLNQKTKKVNVGYFDWENPISDIQNRVKGMCEGLKLDTSTINGMYFFPKNPSLVRVNKYDSFVIEDLRDQLVNFIEENQIKVLFFDTLRRLGNFDENDSGAINTIKTELFDPLINKYEVCIIFLHHTNKEGKDYRGSVDIEGILDTAYSVKKVIKEDFIQLNFQNTKRRNNELEELKCMVTIENEDYESDGEMYEKIINVKFNKMLDEPEADENNIDYKKYRQYMIENLDFSKRYKNKDLCDMLSYNFSVASTKTSNKIIKWLTDIDILKSFGENKSKYYILNPVHADKSDAIQLKSIEKHFITMFNENDLVSCEVLKDKFEEKYYSVILNKWLSNGFLNPAKKGFLLATDTFKLNYPDESIEFDEDQI